jgi:ABC-type uncharacterized transport system permease subunit
MEKMNKTLLYSLVAVVLGLVLMLVPLITLTEVNANGYSLMPDYFSRQLEKVEQTYNSDIDLRIFAVSFVIALIAYLWVKHKMPKRDYGWIGPYRY